MKKLALSEELESSFRDNGFLIYTDVDMTAIRENLYIDLKKAALHVLSRFPETSGRIDELEAMAFPNLWDWIIANEKDNQFSSLLYRLWAALPSVLGMQDHPTIVGLAKAIGISQPIASVTTTIRMDRPGEEKHKTPPHQDYWWSMLSDNSIVVWLALIPVERDMGFLGVIPGTHKKGLIPFKKRDSFFNCAYEPVDEYPESDWVEADIGDGILVFNQFLIHRSGTNQSNRARLTMQLRFNDLETMEELSTFDVQHSQATLRRIQKRVSVAN